MCAEASLVLAERGQQPGLPAPCQQKCLSRRSRSHGFLTLNGDGSGPPSSWCAYPGRGQRSINERSDVTSHPRERRFLALCIDVGGRRGSALGMGCGQLPEPRSPYDYTRERHIQGEKCRQEGISRLETLDPFSSIREQSRNDAACPRIHRRGEGT